MRVPLMLFSVERAQKIGHRFRGLGRLLHGFSGSLRTELISANLAIDPDEYRFSALVSAAIYGLALYLLLFGFVFSATNDVSRADSIGLIAGFVIFVLILLVLLRYPKIIAGKESEVIDKDLVYALKDLLLSVSSGLSTFNALIMVSEGSYGHVSRDIKRVVERVNTGIPLDDALEALAISTPSEHFQNALWQIINTTKSGADVEGVLRSLIENLVAEQRSGISKYSNELNVLTLMYMLAAVAVPIIIITLVIILNAFVSEQVSIEVILLIAIIASLFIQIALIGFVKSRRPVVHV